MFCLGAIAWNGEFLCSGSRDRSILQRDLRVPLPSERKLVGHRQEVTEIILEDVIMFNGYFSLKRL